MRIDKIVLPDGEEITEFGFKAALCGWCSENSENIIQTQPNGQKIFRYQAGDFYFEDAWLQNVVNKIYVGSIMITYQGIQVFTHSYAGFYSPDVVGLVKQALQVGYKSYIMSHGFRGVDGFRSDDFPGLEYKNSTVSMPGAVYDHAMPDYEYDSYTPFAGHERIVRAGTHESVNKGELHYWGAFLV